MTEIKGELTVEKVLARMAEKINLLAEKVELLILAVEKLSELFQLRINTEFTKLKEEIYI